MLLARRAGAFRRALARARAGEPRGIHQARVASRRLREAVPIVAAGVDGVKAGKLRRRIRRVTRTLGSVRELHVTIALVDELARSGTLPRLALEEVRAHAIRELDRNRSDAAARLGGVHTDKLERRLARLADALPAAGGEPWRDVLAARLAKRAKRVEREVDGAGPLYDVERLHAVRIAVKQLRYTVEIAAETGAPAAAGAIRALKRTQRLLGQLHDLQVLQTHVAAVQAAPRPEGLPEEELPALARALEAECRHLHARFLASLPTLRAGLEAVRLEVLPQVAHAAARRPLKMDLRRAGARPARPARRRAEGPR